MDASVKGTAMEPLWRFLDNGSVRSGIFTPESVLLSLLLSFVLGQVLAWVYYGTHNGLSYSRSFVQSLILMTVVVSLVMAVIGNSIITAFGLIGALALVRFRNVLKDTRDTAFIFCSLVIGMAAGSQRYAIAVIGTAVLCTIIVYLHLIGFGSHRPQNAFLRFNLSASKANEQAVTTVLKRFCNSFALISVEDNSFGPAPEHAYQLMVRDRNRNENMLWELEAIPGVSNVNLTMQEEMLEV